MGKLAPTLLVLAILGASLALAAGVKLNPNVRVEFANCPADGGSAQTDAGVFQTISAGTYVFRVTGEDTRVCWATTCTTATSGELWPNGTVMLQTFEASQSLSCYSAGATGDAVFTRAP